jgi:hypothetical protein
MALSQESRNAVGGVSKGLSEHAVDESVIENHPPERCVTKPEQRGTRDARANRL